MGSLAPVASSGWLVGVRFPGLGFCQWSGHPCACCPGALRAVRGSLPSGLFPFCWRSRFQSFFSFSSAQISLSLSRPCLLQPLAPGAIPLVPVSVLATFVARVVPRHLLVAYLLVSLRSCEVFFRFALSHLPGGVTALLLSLGALPARSSGLSGVLVGLPGSLLCLPPGYGSLSSQFPVVWLVLLLPSLRPYTLPLFGLLAVPPFLLSGLVAVCFP